MARTVTYAQAPAEILKLGNDVRRRVGHALFSSAIRGVQVIQTQIIPAVQPRPVDRGVYRAGWRYAVLLEGDTVVGGEIFNNEPVAAFIEKGVRAENVKVGRAMIDALAEWVLRKGIVKKKVTKKRTAEKVASEARSAAWAIALSMKKHGIFAHGQGHHVLGTLMRVTMPFIVKAEIARAMKEK